MKIDRVTITGADTNTEIKDLVSITEQHPFVEWGILFSDKEGRQRYPTKEWKAEVIKHDLPLSAHFCGWWVREILQNQNFDLIRNLEGFNRVQLNYNFGRSKGWDLDALFDFAESFKSINIILQYNKANKSIIDALTDVPNNINFLYDASGGRGTEISYIGDPIHHGYTGYAGGLSTDNVVSICTMITEHESDAISFIDLESGARTDNEFDLGKCRMILDKVKPFIHIPVRYHIETYQDIMDCITVDNIGRFMQDFKALIAHSLLVKVIAEGEGMEEPVRFPHFTWIDDGVREIKMNLGVIDEESSK